MLNNLLQNRYFSILLIIITLVSFGLYFKNKSNDNCIKNLGLRFINPNLDCDAWEEKAIKLDRLQKNIEEKISVYKSLKQATRIGVFVRDMDSLRFVGVNDGEIFYMASLLKLPLLIAGYKLAEVEPRILDEVITFTGATDDYDLEHIKKDKLLTHGESYTIKDLMERSIIYSNNDASRLLFDYYPHEFLDKILQALNIQIRREDAFVENPITARSFANIFRVLYNASYLTREYSNDALSLLTKVVYKGGATANIPSTVSVAHKFAERIVYDEKTGKDLFKQLHECGLVYAQNGKEPYIFCIMTEGDMNSDLEKIQQNISSMIYSVMTD